MANLTVDQIAAAQMNYDQQMKQSNLGIAGPVAPSFPGPFIETAKNNAGKNANDMLLDRLCLRVSENSQSLTWTHHEFEFLQVHVPPSGEVLIFVVYKGEGLHLKDDRELFPSDQLIAQLRMLKS